MILLDAAGEQEAPASVPPNNPIDLQSLKLIDFHLLRWSAQQRLFIASGGTTQ
jgi:hypothetical protein